MLLCETEPVHTAAVEISCLGGVMVSVFAIGPKVRRFKPAEAMDF
jgi:hypothetical protein